MSFRIRQAGSTDLPAAAQCVATCWEETFTGLLSDEAITAHTRAVPATAERFAARLLAGEYIWLVVDADEAVVGVSHARISADPSAPTPLELNLCYLRQRAQGSGIATRLLEVAIGDAPAYLWVLRGNERAAAFYRKHGFVETNRTRDLSHLGAGAVDVQLVRSPS